MKRVLSRTIVAVSIAGLFSSATFVMAAWVDDWITQKTSSSPGYYQGQQRGYATMGGFNARWQTGTDYPLSVNPPKFKAGCGGIDFFGGSISMLNMDMLVAKLQRILQNSAGIAFNMALETVCPKCANIMNVMEQMSNQLNGMGMNDCSIAKGLTVDIRDAGKSVLKNINDTTIGEGVEKSLSDGYEQAKRELTAANGTNVRGALDWLNTKMSTPPNKDPQKSACPVDGSDLFPQFLWGNPVSVLDSIGTKLGLDSSYVSLMRGLVGDITVSSATEGYDISVIAGCSKNNTKDGNLDIEAIKKGTIYAKAADGTCSQIVDANANLVTYVTTQMNNIETKMRSKATLTTSEEAFITQSPLPIAYALKMGIGSGQSGVIISNLSNITATAYAIASISDLSNSISTLMQIGDEQNAKKMKNSTDCNLDVHLEGLKESSKELRGRINQLNVALGAKMQEQLSQYNNVATLVNQLQNLSNQLERDLALRYGPSVARRAIKG